MAERLSLSNGEEMEGPTRDTNVADDQNGHANTAGETPEDPGQPGELCPGCQSVGTLTLPCGHKLCPSCIELSQRELGPASCTICYGSQLMDSVLNTLLDTLFQDLPRRRAVTPGAAGERVGAGSGGRGSGSGCGRVEKEELCEQHGQIFSVFCLQEEEPLCSQCQTEEHENHQCCSIQEAVHNCKKDLRSVLRSLREQLESLTSIRETWEDISAHIKSQSIQIAQILREEFEKMHQFLHDEEAALMSQLKQEEEEKSHRMKGKIDRISTDIQALVDSIRETEETMTFDNFNFLKNYKKTTERAQDSVDEHEDESDTLLDVAKHQSSIQYRVWDKMLKIIHYLPVTMDPNTGSACLSVSPDLSGVHVCEEQPLPDNPERFMSLQSILGSEVFSSGRHSWEVEVGENSQWALGVATETIQRKNWSGPDQNPSPSFDLDVQGLWTVSLSSSGDYQACPGSVGALKLRRKPRRVRVQLDWERGCLTFSDASNNSLIHRFKKQWSGNLRPYFSTTCPNHPLKISAGRVTVNTE